MQLHGHLIKLDVPREETFVSTRVRHAIKSHIISWVRPDGTFAARKLEAFSDQVLTLPMVTASVQKVSARSHSFILVIT